MRKCPEADQGCCSRRLFAGQAFYGCLGCKDMQDVCLGRDRISALRKLGKPHLVGRILVVS